MKYKILFLMLFAVMLIGSVSAVTVSDCRGVGGTISIQDTNYCVHMFYTNSSFNITVNSLDVQILLVAGGGGGGLEGGGGGAGGLNLTNVTVTQNTTLKVGAGGLGGSGVARGENGAITLFGATINVTGGGGGGTKGGGAPSAGGSGGGAARDANVDAGAAGTAGQGFSGGGALGGASTDGGGGGGFAMSGTNGTTTRAGDGGNGTAFSINGTSIYYAGGGGGGTDTAGAFGVATLGGGGNGSRTEGKNGTDGLGGGGGGGGNDGTSHIGGNGGSGVIVVRYLANQLTTTLNTPINNSVILTSSVLFNATIENTYTGDLKNATLYIWNQSGVFNRTMNILTGTSFNVTTFNISNFNLGTYYWNVQSCVDAACAFAITNNTFVYGYNSTTNYNSTAFELTREGFGINVSSTVTSAKLNYAGTNYTASISGGYVNVSLSVPVGAGTNNFYWILNDYFSTSTSTQIVNPIVFGNCNSTLTIPYLNWTFLDEATSTRINGSIDSSSFTYWLSSQSVNKTYSYSNSSLNNKNYDFCFNPNNTAINMLYNVKYSFTGYPQRTLTFGTSSYTNNTKNQTLYLLSSTVGLYVTFQVINAAQQPIEGALVDISRPDLGVNISSSYTDASGGATFWMNPNFAHTIVVTATGYPVYTTSITPSQSVYTITLGSVSNTSITNYIQGVSFNVTPASYELVNNTVYPFNFTISSSYWQMDSVGFYVTNGSMTLCTQSTTNTLYAALSCNLNTGTNKTFVMNYYYVINGSTQNLTKTWVITDLEGSSYSIKNFFTDLSSYLNGGIFGLTKFGLSLIVFFIIFTFAGVLSYKYGLTSPAAIMGIIFALTALFDVGLGLIPSPMDNAIPHLATVVVAIILISILIREGNY
jgi:hypothetical protein